MINTEFFRILLLENALEPHVIVAEFIHQRHKQLCQLQRPRELVVVCSPMRSRVNLSRIVRTASCCAVARLIACGSPKIDPKIARDGAHALPIETPRSLAPVLQSLRSDGYALIGLEQTTNSVSIFEHSYQRRTALVVGNERVGLSDEILRILDTVIEIPVYGMPHSFNVATATAMSLYEYCRQFPEG